MGVAARRPFGEFAQRRGAALIVLAQSVAPRIAKSWTSVAAGVSASTNPDTLSSAALRASSLTTPMRSWRVAGV
jgi:hypothetical protein